MSTTPTKTVIWMQSWVPVLPFAVLTGFISIAGIPRFSLRAMLVAVAVIAVLLAIVMAVI